MSADVLDLQTKYRAQGKQVFLTGVQALVRAPFDQLRADRAAGHRTAAYVSGYPGSPLGGFDQELARQRDLMTELDLVHQPGHNEDLAATAVVGSQAVASFPSPRYDGVLGVWYGKTPGLDRSVDAIRHAQYAGVAPLGGVLAYVGDDPTAKSSDLPYDSVPLLIALGLPVLYPGTLQEVLDLARHGVALSRFCGLWSAMKIVTAIADGVGTVSVGVGAQPVIPEGPAPSPPSAIMAGPRPTALEAEVTEARLNAAQRYVVANKLNRVTVDPPAPRVGLVAPGRTYYEVLTALERLGMDRPALDELGVRVLQIRALNPLDSGTLRSFAAGLNEIVVVEDKQPLLEQRLKAALYGSGEHVPVTGRHDDVGAPLLPGHGTLQADDIIAPLARRLERHLPAERLRRPAAQREKIVLPLTKRTPYFCSGCPHNTSTVVPDDSLVGAGTGCHALALMRSTKSVGKIQSITQMGGEGAVWLGVEPFVDDKHYIQNIGDGTYFHSGQLAVQAAVSAGAHITFKLLYNSAVAMTGGQSPAMSGARPVADLVAILLHQGVRWVIVTTEDRRRYHKVKLPRRAEVWHRDRLVEAQEALRAMAGVTVLIHDQECAAELRRKRKRGKAPSPSYRLAINERVCEGCGDCGVKSNCLSLEPVATEFGRKTRINQNSCNVDYSCLKGDCPSFLTVEPASGGGGGSQRRAVPRLGSDSIPAPTTQTLADPFRVRMPGIGGTGVVTVNQILGTAAMLDGRQVWGLDQTGLSQKAGPVVSDLIIGSAAIEGSNSAPRASTDLLLAFDLLVATDPALLAALDQQRTTAVISTSSAPTGHTVSDPDVAAPDEEKLRRALEQSVSPRAATYVDATGITDALLNDAATANIFLLGVAFQQGAVPVSADAIERAIALNGVAVDGNHQAFRWGRMYGHDPASVYEQLPGATAAFDPADERLVTELVGPLNRGELGRLLRVRVADLIDYQNVAYAERYLAAVRQAHGRETALAPFASTQFTEAVAINLHKLMAYKDEYEVARLHLDGAARARAVSGFAGDVRVHYNLHPPLLRALGLRRKLKLGPWFEPALMALRAGKRLRGTRVDPFGRAAVRRIERALLDEYETLMLGVAERLTPVNHATAVRLARLPDNIRGYEDVKLASVKRYREELAMARRDFAAE